METQPGPPQVSACSTEHAVAYFAATRWILLSISPNGRDIHRHIDRLTVPCLGFVGFVQPLQEGPAPKSAPGEARSALNEDWSSKNTSTPAGTIFFSKFLPVFRETHRLYTGFECLKRANSSSRPAVSFLPSGRGGGHHNVPTGSRTRSISMWALDPHAPSLGLVTVLRRWTCSLVCPVCTSQDVPVR